MSTSPPRSVDEIWRLLCEGLSAPWLEETRVLRADGDDVETSLDIWTVALTGALKDPERREAASLVLTRMRRLSEPGVTPSGRSEAPPRR